MSLVVMTDKTGPELIAKVIGFANTFVHCQYAGMYLQDYFPDRDIKGIFTKDIAKAKRYPDMEAFHADYRYSIGTRRDGKPDRPLTAFDLEIIRFAPPYPFCSTPEECNGKGYCPKDKACND